MKSIMMSIQPQWVAKILNGEIIELVNKKLLPRIKKMKTAEAV